MKNRTGMLHLTSVAFVAFMALMALLASACTAETQIVAPALAPTSSDPQPAAEPAPEVEAEPDTSSEDAADTATSVLQAGLDGSLADVYERIEDSVVYLSTDESSGTGIVIEGGWILTNAHVVDRLESVSVGRADGTDLGDHAVYGTDWVFDVALVGPIDDAGLVPFARTASTDLSIGDVVMLLGFPDEDTVDPTPTLTAGIVSRRRQPSIGNHPFLQVDATIAPGQSGGALVDANGNLMGISGLEFGEGEFGLVLEADAMWPRVDMLLETGGTPGVPEGESIFSLSADVGPRRTMGFIVEVGADGRIALTAESEQDIYIDVQTLGGLTVQQVEAEPDPFNSGAIASSVEFFIDEFLTGAETLDSTIAPGTYQVVIGSFATVAAPVQVTSDTPLLAFADVEEGAPLPLGQVVEGQVDWAQDSDRWVLDLTAGDEVSIAVDGIADMVVVARLNGAPVASADDNALGLFGFGALLEFTAPETARYELEVGSFDATRWGYLIEASVN